MALRREIWSAIRDFHTPDLFVPCMYVFYNTDIMQLEVPPLVRVQDRLTVIDMLYNLGTPNGHDAHNLKVKMFDTQNISIEESYVLKRVLRGFRSLSSLIIWKVGILQLSVLCYLLHSLNPLWT